MAAANEELSTWSLGLINSDKKYLTEEVFGGKLTATGASLRFKQIFHIQTAPTEGMVALRSNSGKYVTAHSDGKVDCNGTDIDKEQSFTVEVQPSGQWAFKAASTGRWFGGVGEKLDAFSKVRGVGEEGKKKGG